MYTCSFFQVTENLWVIRCQDDRQMARVTRCRTLAHVAFRGDRSASRDFYKCPPRSTLNCQHASLSLVEISTEICICRCTFQWISQHPSMKELCFNISNKLRVSSDSVYSVEIVLPRKKVVLYVLVTEASRGMLEVKGLSQARDLSHSI